MELGKIIFHKQYETKTDASWEVKSGIDFKKSILTRPGDLVMPDQFRQSFLQMFMNLAELV